MTLPILKSHNTKNKNKNMKKQTLLAMAFCLMSLSPAQAKNFWLKLDAQHIAAQQAHRSIAQWLAVPVDSEFELVKDYTDHLGFRHQVFQQYVAGVRVEGGIVKVHSRQGVVTSANGHVVERAELKQTVRRVSHNGALTDDGRFLVLVEVDGVARYAYKHYDRFGQADVLTDAETGEELKRLPRLRRADVKTTGQSLYSGECEFMVNPTTDGRYALTDSARRIFTLDARGASSDLTPYADGQYREGYDVRSYVMDNTQPLYNSDPNWSMLRIDSIVIDSICPLYTVRKYGTPSYNLAATVYYPNASGQLEEHNGGKLMVKGEPLKAALSEFQVEVGVPVAIRLEWFENNSDRTGHKADLIPTATAPGSYPWELKDEEGRVLARGSYVVSRTAHFAVDVHWGMEQTYDFYKNCFQRDSYDDQGAPIYNIVYPLAITGHEDEDEPIMRCPEENAAAIAFDSFTYMIYGFGGNYFKTTVALDVMAHEYTHLVTFATSNLDYMGESGALNESFSDIIGVSVKQTAKQCPDNWLMGDEMALTKTIPAARSMQDPEEFGDPGTYQGTYWADPTKQDDGDNGGVHTNSGVQNHWYYYLVKGGEYTDRQGIKHTFVGIGLDRAVQIAYRNFTEMLTPTAQYRDAVLGSIQAVEDLYGAESAERQAVVDAWAAVGLLSDGTSGIALATSTVSTTDDGVIYRLDGTRTGATTMQGLAPGIYIQHGRKVVVK